jgi:hypothetical protein
MPTRKQIENAVEMIKDAISSDFIVRKPGTNDQPGRSEAPGVSEWQEKLFHMLEPAEQIAALGKHVEWEGFSESDKSRVIRSVLEGKDEKNWMNGVEATHLHEPGDYHTRFLRMLYDDGKQDISATQERDIEGLER